LPHIYVTGYQVNSGEFFRGERFYIASSPQDADNKGSVSLYCITTLLIACCSEVGGHISEASKHILQIPFFFKMKQNGKEIKEPLIECCATDNKYIISNW
jgi:hypothetical protein